MLLLYIAPLLASAAIGLVLVHNILRFRTARGAKPLLALASASILWAVCYALEIASPDLTTKLFWAKIEYLGIIVIPPAWLIFSAQYRGSAAWLERSPRNQILLWTLPVLTLCLVWTNELHHLVWRQVGLDPVGNFSILHIDHGPWFWVLLTFSYCLLLLGSAWLAATMFRARSIERRVTAFALIGILIPWIANLVYLTNLNPIPELDWTPFAFILTGVMFSLSLFRFKLLNIAPLAHKNIFEGLSDVVVVLDLKNRVVDLNAAAHSMLGEPDEISTGQPFAQRFPEFATAFNGLSLKDADQIDVPYGEIPDLRFINLQVLPLYNERKTMIGRLVTLRDITQRKREQAQLEQIRNNLEKSVREQTAALEQTNQQLQLELAQRTLAENRFEQIVQSAPDAMFLVNRDHQIVLVNDQAERLFGRSQDELSGQDIRILLPERYHARHHHLMDQFIANPATRSIDVAKDLSAKHQDGHEFPVEISLSPLQTTDGVIIACVVRDISKRKQAELALKESEHTYRVLFENASDAILLVKLDGSIFKVNPRFASLLGYSIDELTGMTIHDIILPEEHQSAEDKKKAVLIGQTLSPYERKFRNRAGDVIPIEITIAVVPDANGDPKFIQSIGRDITDRKKAEQEQIRLMEQIRKSQERLRLLTYHLQEVQETERRQIASVLHDRVGQNLTGLNLILHMVQNQLSLESRPAEREQMNDALHIVEEITRQVRDVMSDLHPPLLEEYGLFSALDWYSAVFSQRTGIAVQVFGVEFTPRLPPGVEMVLFRIAQEALNNVAKHARAKRVILRIESSGKAPCLSIEDDGLGFDTTLINAPSQEPHWGLLSMQERAASVGGELSIHSDPGEGTCVQVNLGS